MNATDNPFALNRLQALRHRLPNTTWEEVLSQLQRHRFRGAVVGGPGSGKSHFLHELSLRLRAQGHPVKSMHLTPGRRKFPPSFLKYFYEHLDARDVILFDGAEYMGPLQWWHFRWRTRRVSGLIATRQGVGLLPTLLKCRPDLALFEELVAELLGPEASRFSEQTRAVHQKFGGNFSEAFLHSYDLYTEGTQQTPFPMMPPSSELPPPQAQAS